MEDVVKIFIAGAKKVYKLKGFTQRTLADAVESNQGTLSSYFILRTRIKPDMMQKISKALETPYEEILKIGREELILSEKEKALHIQENQNIHSENNITTIHKGIVEKFIDKDEGLAANKALLIIEKHNPVKFIEVVAELKKIAKQLEINAEKKSEGEGWDNAANQD